MTLQEIANQYELPIKVSIIYERHPIPYYYLEKIVDGKAHVGWDACKEANIEERHNYPWTPSPSFANKFIPHPEVVYTHREQIQLINELKQLLKE